MAWALKAMDMVLSGYGKTRVQETGWSHLTHGICSLPSKTGFPGGTSGREPTRWCKRHKRRRFHLWVWKIPWRPRSLLCNTYPWSFKQTKVLLILLLTLSPSFPGNVDSLIHSFNKYLAHVLLQGRDGLSWRRYLRIPRFEDGK